MIIGYLNHGSYQQEGYRPDRIISPALKVGGLLHPDASKGTTQVYMNNRELGKLELKMLKVRFLLGNVADLSYLGFSTSKIELYKQRVVLALGWRMFLLA